MTGKCHQLGKVLTGKGLVGECPWLGNVLGGEMSGGEKSGGETS